jgi:hypothetical protein
VNVAKAARFAAIFGTLYAAHQVADHHVQSDRDAQVKGWPGPEGRKACARHVASYTATAAVALAVTDRVTGAGIRPGKAAAALAFSALTHYVIDRREPLRRFAEATGHGNFYRLGAPREGRDDNPNLGTGAYAMDQSAHVGALLIASWIAA